MNICKRKPLRLATRLFSMLLGGLVLHACGGGGGDSVSGIGGTGIVFGTITGFGSIYVNGDRYRTGSSDFIVDGDLDKSQDDLAVGMVVRLRVEIENGVRTNNAVEVEYDDEVQGPVAAVPVDVPGSGGKLKTFEVFGQTVTVDATTTIFDGTSFDGLGAGEIVEVSGFRSSPTAINASYVQRKGDVQSGVSEVELRGTIENHDAGAREFMLGTVRVTYDGSTEIEVADGGLADGQYVEVEGIYNDTPSVYVYADEIELEEEGFGDDIDEISLQGVISSYIDIDDFEINGQPIDASAAVVSPGGAQSQLGNGVNVEVEGDIVNGVLIAESLELREGESGLKSIVDSVDLPNSSFRVGFAGLGTVDVYTDTQTTFEDDVDVNPLENMKLTDLTDGDFVEVEGIASDDGILASVVKRKDDPGELELEGPVESYDNIGFGWIRVLGLDYVVDPLGGTDFPGFTDATEFFGELEVDDVVEIKDDSANGTADEVELKD